MKDRDSIVKKVALISVWSNIILAFGKILIGITGNSSAVFADGIHSAADVFASFIVLLVIKISNKPADKEHPYGHGKAEIIVSGVVGIMLMSISIYMVYEVITGLFHTIEVPGILAMCVSIFSFLLKEFLYRYSFRISEKYSSKAVQAIALDHKSDVLASIMAAIGVFLTLMGSYFHFKFLLYGDKIATLFVAYLIFKISKEMLKESFDILLERNIDLKIIQEYEKTIFGFFEVKRIDRIRAREHGHYILVDLRISIDYNKTIKEGHDLSTKIKEKIMDENDNVREVLIHLNPYYPE